MNKNYLVNEKVESIFELLDFRLLEIDKAGLYRTVLYLSERDFNFKAAGALTKDEFAILKKGDLYLIRGSFDECDEEIGMAVECVSPGCFAFIHAHTNLADALPSKEEMLEYYYQLFENGVNENWHDFVKLLLKCHENMITQKGCEINVLKKPCSTALEMAYMLSKALEATCNHYPHIVDTEVAQTLPLLYAISMLPTDFDKLAEDALFYNDREKELLNCLMEYRVLMNDLA